MTRNMQQASASLRCELASFDRHRRISSHRPRQIRCTTPSVALAQPIALHQTNSAPKSGYSQFRRRPLSSCRPTDREESRLPTGHSYSERDQDPWLSDGAGGAVALSFDEVILAEEAPGQADSSSPLNAAKLNVLHSFMDRPSSPSPEVSISSSSSSSSSSAASIAAPRTEALAALAGCLLINVFSGSLFTWSCYLLPMELSTGAGRTLLSSVFSTTLLSYTAGASFVFPVLSKHLSCATLGLLTTCASATGLLVCSLVGPTPSSSIPLLLFGFSLCFGMGSGLAYSLTVTVANSDLFSSCRGLATGLTVSARAAGPAMLAPLLEHLLEHGGLAQTFQAHAAVLLLASCLPAMYLLPRTCCGTAAPPVPIALGTLCRKVAKESWSNFLHVFNPDALSMQRRVGDATVPVLWLRGALGCGSFYGLLLLSHSAALIGSLGGGPVQIATALSTISACGALGRIAGGYICDRLSTPVTMLKVVPLLTIPFLLWAAHSPSLLSAQVALAVGGIGYGIGGIAVPVHVSDTLGSSKGQFTGIYGQILLAWGVSGVVAPLVGGYLFDLHGNYTRVLLLAAAAALSQSMCGWAVERETVQGTEPEAALAT